jgi:hypothetical protein
MFAEGPNPERHPCTGPTGQWPANPEDGRMKKAQVQYEADVESF